MALPYSSSNNFPFGLDVASINSVNYVVESYDLPTQVTRTISRSDENGDRSDFMVRVGSEPISGTMTLQRETTSTPIPPSGEEFVYDFGSGNVNVVVSDTSAARSRDAADTFTIGIVVTD